MTKQNDEKNKKQNKLKNFVDEAILVEEIESVFEDPRYKDNFKLYPNFKDIATIIAIDYKICDMPNILKQIKIKPFGLGSQLMGIYKTRKGQYSTGAMGLSCKKINPKYNKTYEMRNIFINQYYADRDRFDFEDFSVHIAEKYGKNFDRARREEVSSQNALVEKILFEDYEFFGDEGEQKTIHGLFAPRVRPKDGFGALFESLEKGFSNPPKKKETSQEKYNRTEEKSTVCHEGLHSFSHQRGMTLGGIPIALMMLHEGMTEYLTVKTIERHKDFFERNKNKKVKPFIEYKPFCAYAEMMNTIFPGSIEDVYFNGPMAIKKYQKDGFSLQGMIDGFSAIQRFYDLEKEDSFEDKQYGLNHMIKSLLKQKEGTKALLDSKQITPKQYNRFVENIQVCYDSLLKNKNFEMEFDFKTEDKPLSKNHLRKQRQEHFAFVRK